MSAGSSCAPCATAANEPIPRAIRPSRPSTETVTPSSLPELAGGVGHVARRHLVGRRVLQVARELTACVTIVASSTTPDTSSCAETISASTSVRSSDGEALKRSYL